MPKIQHSNIEKLILEFTGKRTEFKQELQKVREKYPLVYLGFLMQQVALTEIHFPYAHAEKLVGALSGATLAEEANRIGVAMSNCWRKFDRDAGRAQNYEQVASAFETLSECLRRATR